MQSELSVDKQLAQARRGLWGPVLIRLGESLLLILVGAWVGPRLPFLLPKSVLSALPIWMSLALVALVMLAPIFLAGLSICLLFQPLKKRLANSLCCQSCSRSLFWMFSAAEDRFCPGAAPRVSAEIAYCPFCSAELRSAAQSNK